MEIILNFHKIKIFNEICKKTCFLYGRMIWNRRNGKTEQEPESS